MSDDKGLLDFLIRGARRREELRKENQRHRMLRDTEKFLGRELTRLLHPTLMEQTGLVAFEVRGQRFIVTEVFKGFGGGLLLYPDTHGMTDPWREAGVHGTDELLLYIERHTNQRGG